MNTTNTGLGQWKKQSQLIVLEPLLTEKFRRSVLFRQRILQLVQNPWEQIQFNFEYDERDFYFTVGKAEILASTCTMNDESICIDNI
jgi:hypothetical protein